MESQRVPIGDPARVAEQRIAGETRRYWKGRITHEAKRFLGMFLYLFILFGLFTLHEMKWTPSAGPLGPVS